jgi:hypothetical protein
MEREFNPDKIKKFVDKSRNRAIGILEKTKEYMGNLPSSDMDELDSTMSDIGATVMAQTAIEHPAMLLVAQEIVNISSMMFWAGYYLGAIRPGVPDVFRKSMEQID